MKNKRFLSISIMLVVALVLFSTAVFAQEGEFKITGLTEEDITVSISELKNLPTVTKDVTSVDSSGDEDNYTVTGALFSDLLEKKGKSQKDLKAVRFIASDGYSIEVSENILENRDIILTYEIDGEPLYEEAKPMRIVIPEERAMYWVKKVTEIKVIDMKKTVEIKSLAFLETINSELEKVDYTYYESEDQAVKISELVKKLDVKETGRTVYMEAADGFTKDEKTEIFENGYIKVTGEYVPMFLSPDIPKGMYVKNLLFARYGTASIFSLEQALNVYEHQTIGENNGVPLAKVIEISGLKEGDKYKLTAIDGYSVEVNAEEIKDAILYFDGENVVRVSFANLSGKYSVKYLYKILPIN